MVSMVKFPLCARVSVHFKKAYFAYFVAYIAHSSVSVIGDISRRFAWLTCDLFHKLGFRETACDVFHNIRHSLLVIVFTMAGFPWVVCGVCEGGVWCSVVRGVCCWGCGVCEGRYPSDAL